MSAFDMSILVIGISVFTICINIATLIFSLRTRHRRKEESSKGTSRVTGRL